VDFVGIMRLEKLKRNHWRFLNYLDGRSRLVRPEGRNNIDSGDVATEGPEDSVHLEGERRGVRSEV